MTTKSDIDVILPKPTEITFANTAKGNIVRMKTRQFFILLRIITRSGGTLLDDLSVDSEGKSEEALKEEWGAKILFGIIQSLSESEDLMIEFLRSMIEPVLPIARPVSDEEKEVNALSTDLFIEAVSNPELDDLITMVEKIVANEMEDITALGKRLMAMFQIAVKTGQVSKKSADRTTEILASL